MENSIGIHCLQVLPTPSRQVVDRAAHLISCYNRFFLCLFFLFFALRLYFCTNYRFIFEVFPPLQRSRSQSNWKRDTWCIVIKHLTLVCAISPIWHIWENNNVFERKSVLYQTSSSCHQIHSMVPENQWQPTSSLRSYFFFPLSLPPSTSLLLFISLPLTLTSENELY